MPDALAGPVARVTPPDHRADREQIRQRRDDEGVGEIGEDHALDDLRQPDAHAIAAGADRDIGDAERIEPWVAQRGPEARLVDDGFSREAVGEQALLPATAPRGVISSRAGAG